MSVDMENGRFADGSRSWQTAQEVGVTDWDKDTVGIFAMGIASSTHNGDVVVPEIRWRNVTDGGGITVLGASGEVKYASVSALTDEADLTTGNMGTSGTTRITGVTCEQENSGIATNSTTLAKGEATEIQVGISFADGDPGDEYEFHLYESGVQINDPSAATVTLLSEGATTPQSVVATAIGVALVRRKISKTVTATAVGSPVVTTKAMKTVVVVATAIGVPVVVKTVKKIIAATATANPSIVKKVLKNISATAVGSPSVTRKMFVIVTATAVGSPSVVRKMFVVAAATAVGTPLVSTVVKSTQSVVATAIGVATTAQNFIAAGAFQRTLARIIGALGWIGNR